MSMLTGNVIVSCTIFSMAMDLKIFSDVQNFVYHEFKGSLRNSVVAIVCLILNESKVESEFSLHNVTFTLTHNS